MLGVCLIVRKGYWKSEIFICFCMSNNKLNYAFEKLFYLSISKAMFLYLEHQFNEV